MSGSAFSDPLIVVTGSPWSPASSEDRDAVLQQLDRMLAHPSFRNSRRYSNLFRYVVERTLRGDRNLKERVLGIEVFGREPNYDTNEDPVVRVTAGEIRRRIAQYYYEPGHETEIRIELQAGSYNPLFRLPPQAPSSIDAQLISSKTRAGFAQSPELAEEVSQPTQVPEGREEDRTSTWSDALSSGRPFVFRTVAILALVCLAALAFLWGRVGPRATLDQFWTPVLASKLPVLICIPDLDSVFSDNNTNAPPAVPSSQAVMMLGRDSRRQKVAFSDSIALANLTKLLGSKDVDFRIKRSEDASLDDLKGGPVVLVAGGNNRWTMQLGKQLRFTFERDGDVRYIKDENNPSSRQWSVSGPDTATGQVADYAIVSRVFNATTGGVLVTAAGLHHNGTEAAGMCLASESCLLQAGKMASGDWSKGNIEFVVATTIVGDDPGQPRVVAARIW